MFGPASVAIHLLLALLQSIIVNNFCVFRKNGKNIFFKHYFLRGKSAKITKEKLDKYYGTSAPSDYMVRYWFAEFKRCRTDKNDEHRSGRPKEVTTQEMINKIHDLVLNNRRVKVRELEEACNISHGTAISILQDGCRVCSQSIINEIV